MPKSRYYHPEYPFKIGQSLTLEGGESAHLAKVMRGHVGDVVELVNGLGELAHAKVEDVKKISTSLKIEDIHREKPTLSPITLIQSLIKLPKLEWIVEKVTELGASSIWLFPAEQSEVKELSTQKLFRLRSISISAMKQCGRLYLPHIEVHPSLSRLAFPKENAFYGDLGAPLLDSQKINHAHPTYVFIGPEKGWTEQERKILSQHATAISFHLFTLRAETAAIYSIGLLSYLSQKNHPAFPSQIFHKDHSLKPE